MFNLDFIMFYWFSVVTSILAVEGLRDCLKEVVVIFVVNMMNDGCYSKKQKSKKLCTQLEN